MSREEQKVYATDRGRELSSMETTFCFCGRGARRCAGFVMEDL